MSSALAAAGPQRFIHPSRSRSALSSPYPTSHPSTSATTFSHAHPAGGANRRTWNAPLPATLTEPQPLVEYPAGLSLAASPLRPRCPARDRLRLWRPVAPRSTFNNNGDAVSVTTADIQRIHDVIVHAWAETTLVTYASGLLVWHCFCDFKAIPEIQRAPASNLLIQSFLSTLAGAYAGGTIANYLYGVRAWHLIHGVKWEVNETEMDLLLKAAERTAPPSSTRKKRRPYTPAYIEALRTHLDLNNPLDAACFACLTTTFYSAARLGEFTVRTLKSFDVTKHVQRHHVSTDRDRNGNTVTSFALPWTKTAPQGETVAWARQDGLTDPEAAYAHHVQINDPPINGPLFAYRHGSSHKPLTKSKFLSRLKQAAEKAALDPLQGHGIRIGATLEYLLRGVPIAAMKLIGRWASDAFEVYLRKHAQVLAPYLQAHPDIHATVTNLSMNASRRR